MTASFNKKRLIPTENLRELTRNSMEHLHLRIDDALSESVESFVGGEPAELSRLATFSDYVIAGTDDGRYFRAAYVDSGQQIKFTDVTPVEIPVVDASNYQQYIESFTGSLVESLLAGKTDVTQLVSLMTLDESVEELKDLAALVSDIVKGLPKWKSVYKEQRNTIINQIGEAIDLINGTALEPKYSPLYDGSIPEENFYQYLDIARRDCETIEARLKATEAKVESAYLPFSEKISKSNMAVEDKETVQQFIAFADGLSGEIHALREHVRLAVENEQCAMCLGQIYDTIAESLNDYEIAGSFVERMAVRFTTAEL